MIELNDIEGTCICGKVKVTVKTLSTKVGACHCGTCRKWTGGPLLAVDCGTEVSFNDSKQITEYASSEWASRGFCSACGTHLYYKLKHNSQHIMPVGLFDIDASLELDHQIFIDKKPAYYDFANETKNMTGEEVFAQAMAGDSK